MEVLANALLRKMWTRAHVAFFHPVRCLKYLVLDIEGHVPRAGLSFDDPRACPNIILYNVDVAPLLHKVPSNPRVTLTRERQRSKRWLVPRILNGMSRERACPLIIQGLVQISFTMPMWPNCCTNNLQTNVTSRPSTRFPQVH